MRTFVLWVTLLIGIGASACAAHRLRPSEQVASPTAMPSRGTSSASLLLATARSALAAGSGDMHQLGAGIRDVGESLDGFIFLEKGACAIIYARSGSSIVDLDLYAYADDGTQFGADEAPDDLPTLLLCATEQKQRLFVSAKVAQGHGLVAMAMHNVESTKRAQIAAAVGAREHALKVLPPDEAWPVLKQKLDGHLLALGGAWMQQRQVAVPVDSRLPTRIDAVVPAHGCLDIMAFSEDRFMQLELEVIDEDGRFLSRAVEQEQLRFAVLCADLVEQPVHFDLRPQAGQGLVLLALSTSKEPAAYLSFPADLKEIVVVGETAQLGHPYGSKPVATETITVVPGGIVSLERETKGCHAYALSSQLESSSGVRGRMSAWTREGELLGEVVLPLSPVLEVCYRGKIRLDIEASSRTQSVRFLDYAAPLTEAELFNSPLASSRALARARSLLSLLHHVDRPIVSALNLRPSQLHRFDLSLGAHTCTILSIGTADSAVWMDLRLYSQQQGSSGVLQKRAWGRGSTGLGYCSGDKSQQMMVEIRSSIESKSATLLRYVQIVPEASD